jgi:hypothetical protein
MEASAAGKKNPILGFINIFLNIVNTFFWLPVGLIGVGIADKGIVVEPTIIKKEAGTEE